MKISQIKNPESIIGALLFPLFFLPFGIQNIRKVEGRICLILFISFFGYQLIYHPEGTVFGNGADCARYAVVYSWASSLQNISFGEFFVQLGTHDNVDYFNPILIFTVSRITTNIHVYFMVYAFIFALFYINNIYIVLNHCDKNLDTYWKLLFVVFSLIMSIHDFGGVRMPLAFQVYLYGVLKYVFLHSKKGFIWVCCSMLVHFSMFIFVAVFFLFLVIYKMNVRYFGGLFIFAHILSSIDIAFIQLLFSYLPGNMADRLFLYTNEANLEQLTTGGKFYLGEMNLWGRLDSIILRNYIAIAFGWLFIRKVNLVGRYEFLFKLSLYIYSVALLLSNMPSGYRFILPGAYICFATVLIMTSNDFKINRTLFLLNKWYSPVLVIFLFHRLRFIINEVGFSVFYTNFITMFFVDDNVPLLETIKSMI